MNGKLNFTPLALAFLCTVLYSATNTRLVMGDQEHIQALKDFVPDHPHLHNLVDDIHAGDMDAKHKFERESLSVRFNTTKNGLPEGTDEEHVVLHFLDDYTSHVTGGSTDHQFMNLEPFINMLGKEDDLKKRLVELGKKLEAAECDFTCLGGLRRRLLY